MIGRLLRRVPRAGWLIFAAALLNAAVWTAVTPPFQVPDETTHFAYAQYLAETGSPPPQGPGTQYSPEEAVTLNNLLFFDVIGHPTGRGILNPGEQVGLDQSLAAKPSRRGDGAMSSVTNQPPLYYAFEAIPYWLSPSQNILTRLELMRLLSSLFVAVTALSVFLFLRELAPSRPWAWRTGGLVVAFQPQFAFIASGVQADSLLFLAAALTFLALARAWRLGLTRGRGAAIGLATAVGLLSKLTFVALVPGIGLAVVALVWRSPRARRRAAALSACVAAALAAGPVLAYGALNALAWDRGVTGGGFAGAATGGLPGNRVISLHETLDYIWQLYLPRLPFMNHRYFTYSPLKETFFNGTIGHFGWLDYEFPSRVYRLAQLGFLVLAALALAGVWRVRHRLRADWPLLLAFATMALGLMAAIGYAGIRYLSSTGDTFEQARYLFPLLALYALLVVLAANGLPRRWAPAFGAVLVVLAMAHGLFAQLLTISRYYA